MKLGIDLHNIRDGGGINYVANLIAAFRPDRHGFDTISLFGAPEVLAQIPDVPAVEKRCYPVLSRSLPFRLYFLFVRLDAELRRAGCDLLYAPGGLYPGGFRPFATISRNMMPFARDRWQLYGLGPDLLRLHLLRKLNAATFRRADRMIYLTQNAAEVIGSHVGKHRGEIAVVAHGVNRERFCRPAGRPLPASLDPGEAIQLVYPSRLEPYKHQRELIAAVAALRDRFPRLSLDLYGPANRAYLALVKADMNKFDPGGAFVRYHGSVPNADLPRIYAGKHILVFASSCENLPNILIEALEFCVPVLSSRAAPMPEIAGDACVYFEPDSSQSIAAAIEQAILHWPDTLERVRRGRAIAARYSWERCADETFGFLHSAVARRRPVSP